MHRHYYVTEDLNDLEQVENQLIENGLSIPQIHVLSENDAAVEKHHLHAIESVLKKDVVHSTEMGALIGVVLSAIILSIVYFAGWHENPAGWMPFIFLSIVILGFCTWEGGLIGIQVPNYQFKQYQKFLKEGKHIFFVDFDPDQKDIIESVAAEHSHLQLAGTGEATPRWVVKGQEKIHTALHMQPQKH